MAAAHESGRDVSEERARGRKVRWIELIEEEEPAHANGLRLRDRAELVHHLADGAASRSITRRRDPLILTLVPATIDRLYGAGNWKDVESLRVLLGEMGEPQASLGIPDREPEAVLDSLTEAPDAVIVHYSFWPELLGAIRLRFPKARVCVRAHNAEAWHHWHRTAEEPRRLRNLYGVARLLLRDSACRRTADAILGISDWDNRHYWTWLPGKGLVVDVPYSSPWPYLRPHVTPRPWKERHSAVVCLAGGRDRISRTSVQAFTSLASAFRSSRAGAGWSFQLSPGVHSREAAPASSAVTVLPEVAEPWDLLCASRAVAVLTPLGYGAKTTVVDAVAAGCHVLAHPSLAARLPAELRGACVYVDPARPDIETVAARLAAPPAPQEANQALRERALQGLRTALSIHGR
jgi:hypothetical protein